MDELDPALLDEAALRESFASWTGTFEGPASDQDADMFALVDDLDLDDACIPLPEAAEQDTLAMHPNIPAPQEEAKAKSKDTIRIERIRARNRQAQARYRQKSKGQAAELEGSISHIQSSITTAQARQRQLHSQHLQLTQRCSNSCAALDAMTSVTCMLPPSAAHHAPEALPAVLSSPTTAAAPVATPPVTSASTPMMSASLVATLSRKSSRLFERSAAEVPPSLTAFRYYRTVSPSQVKAFAEYLHPSAPHLVVDEYTTSSSQFNTRKMTHEFRSSEAIKCGCGVSDIAWFVTTHLNMLGHSTAGTAGVLSAAEDGGAAASCSEMLSFSTTFNSGPCVASVFAIYLHLSLENTLTHRAVELLKGTAPEDLVGSLATSNGETVDSNTMESLNLGEIVGPGFQNKRRRDMSGLPKATRYPLKSTAELMASVGLTQEDLAACFLRCGVGDLVPMRQAVRQMITDTVKRFSGIVPLELMRQCMEQVIETQDKMLAGLAKAAPASSSDRNTTPPSQQTASSDQGSQSWPPNDDPTATGPPRHAMDATHPRSNHGETSGGGGASWEQQYQKECGLHTMGVILTMLTEMNALIDDLPAVISQASNSQQLTTIGAVLHHSSVLVHDFIFTELISCVDSTKFIFNLMIDSLVPFMGSYFKVDNMHVDLYKVLKPTPDQRARMADMWAVWERSKRQHDGDMHAARTLLDSLPSHIPLPHEFLSHLNALLATPRTHVLSGHNQMIEAHPLSFAQFPQFCSSSTAAKSALIENLEACFFNPCSAPGPSQTNSSGRTFGGRHNAQSDVHYNQASAIQMALLQDPQRLNRSSVSGTEQDNRLEPGVRFLGQFPADMGRAERAAHELQVVQQNECDVFVEALSSQIPGVLLYGEQTMRIWADHFIAQTLPTDFMELCQIAATQQNRKNLFEAPF